MRKNVVRRLLLPVVACTILFSLAMASMGHDQVQADELVPYFPEIHIAVTEPVNGACGTAAKSYAYTNTAFSGTYCSAGTEVPASPIFPAQGGSTSWTCVGKDGGTNASCTASRAAAPVNGACGGAAVSYAFNAAGYSDSYCSVGSASPATPSFPAQGGSTSWSCNGSNGGTNASCTASRAAAPVNGACGTPNNSCTVGTSFDLPDTATHRVWQCVGSNGGSTASCSKLCGGCGCGVPAYRDACGDLCGTAVAPSSCPSDTASLCVYWGDSMVWQGDFPAYYYGWHNSRGVWVGSDEDGGEYSSSKVFKTCRNGTKYLCGCLRFEGCFAPGTKIRMADGSDRPIESINAGEAVLNPITGRSVRIKQIIEGPETLPLVVFGFGSTVIRVSQKHPVLTEAGLVRASQLNLGDRVRGEDGAFHEITILHEAPVEEGQRVINFVFEGSSMNPNDHMLLSDGIVTGNLFLQNDIIKD